MKYIIIRCQPFANQCADKIKLNPFAYNYKMLTDPRREGQYLLVVVDEDEYVLFSQLYQTLDLLFEENPHLKFEHTVLN